ncbi:MAG: aryl-sulfate sulfotransferase [Bacteroidetes bacterium]|nr:aryl-sulfate sulfotransferase [Bacteroidota bacterium]
MTFIINTATLALFISSIILIGCNRNKINIQSINFTEFYEGNLKLKIDFFSNENDSIKLTYWLSKQEDDRKSIIFKPNLHSLIYLSELKSNSSYSFLFETLSKNRKSDIHFFNTSSLSKYIQLNISKINYEDSNTIICILGSEHEPTSYGCKVVEINKKGDTLLNLLKGKGDFIYTPHHDVIKDSAGNIAILYLEKRIQDLSSIGGKVKDTITGDGIQVFNSKGKQIWKWSVFDVINPLKEKDILKKKSDWLHANSLSYDYDGNYLISFFNSGQVWKINKKTGKVIWTFGKTGNLHYDKYSIFSQSHAFHSIGKGEYMCFDNQLETKVPKIHTYEINESNGSARSTLNISLTSDLFTDRMGSSYFINDSLILTCLSKKGKLVLNNKLGNQLWGMQIENITPYRAEFISQKRLNLFLNQR